MGAALVQQRLIALLSSLFGGLALLLACVGLYGLLAFAMVQRTGEMGVRMALGARRTDVVWLVVREAWLLVGIGILVGVPAALAVARIASSQISGLLFGLEATDPMIIGAATSALIAVATFAAYLPARRASCVDPMVALRAE
jgi:ABC-type antimicrobial peptide transport system permease subunit